MYSIIIVDDELVALNGMAQNIPWEKYGVGHVYKASSMLQAQKAFKQHKIDIMFCDIEMPQGNGLELFEWVKCFFPYVECVYVTCHPEYDYMRQALKLGSFDYILKPVDEEDMDELFPQLARRIDQWRAQNGHYEDGSQVPMGDDESAAGAMGESARRIIEMTCGYIRKHLEAPISVNDIADEIHVSPGHLMRVFRRGMHCSVVEYMTETRIESAKALLKNTGKSIQEIAGDVGYPNYVYFSRIFKRMTDMTPNEYRKSGE